MGAVLENLARKIKSLNIGLKNVAAFLIAVWFALVLAVIAGGAALYYFFAREAIWGAPQTKFEAKKLRPDDIDQVRTLLGERENRFNRASAADRSFTARFR